MKIRKILVSAVILFFSFLCGAKSVSYSGYMFDYNRSASCLTELSESSFYFSPAALISVDSAIINSELSLSRFGLPELNTLYLSGIKRISGNLSAGIFFSGEGNNLFNEFFAGIAGSYRLTDIFSFGLSSGISRRDIKDYGKDYEYNINLGVLFRLNKYFFASVTMQNIAGGSVATTNNSGKMLIAGIGSNPIEILYLDLSVLTDFNRTSGINMSMKYIFDKFLAVRLGFLTNPSTLSLGLGITVLNSFRLNAETHYNLNLGFDNRLGFSYYF